MILPADVLKTEMWNRLSPRAKKLLPLLAVYANFEDYTFWPSVLTLTKVHGSDKRTIRAAIKDLIDANIIIVIDSPKGMSKKYKFVEAKCIYKPNVGSLLPSKEVQMNYQSNYNPTPQNIELKTEKERTEYFPQNAIKAGLTKDQSDKLYKEYDNLALINLIDSFNDFVKLKNAKVKNPFKTISNWIVEQKIPKRKISLHSQKVNTGNDEQNHESCSPEDIASFSKTLFGGSNEKR